MKTNREQILSVLEAHRSEISRRFGVRRIALFGSAARDELRPESDVDVLIEFEGPSSFDGYFGLKDFIELLLGRPVDLVTDRGLKPRARRHVERDIVRVT